LHAQPIAEGIYTDEEIPRLIGGRELATGNLVFPCPVDSEKDLFEPFPLARVGTVWSYTCQRFRPKSPPYEGPAEFTPFLMAYVELPEQVIVAARLVEVTLEAVRIGMPVELCFVPLDPDLPESVLIHAFRPSVKQVRP
jgi:hypothetical protein